MLSRPEYELSGLGDSIRHRARVQEPVSMSQARLENWAIRVERQIREQESRVSYQEPGYQEVRIRQQNQKTGSKMQFPSVRPIQNIWGSGLEGRNRQTPDHRSMAQ